MGQLESFVNQVETFLRRTKMTPTRFGVLAVRDPSFIRQLRSGRAPHMGTADRVLAFMREYETAHVSRGRRQPEAAA